MADYTKARRIGYFTMNPRNDLVRQHIRVGGLAVVLGGNQWPHDHHYDDGSHMPWFGPISSQQRWKAGHAQRSKCHGRRLRCICTGHKAQEHQLGCAPLTPLTFRYLAA